jgi:hypothetical protein
MPSKRYSDVHPLNIHNLPLVKSWFDAEGNKELSFERTMLILGDNRSSLAKLYGKRQQTFTSEFRFDVWRIESDGLYFWILSAKSKGTSIEVESPIIWDKEDEYRVINFLNTLFTDLKEIEDKAEEMSYD